MTSKEDEKAELAQLAIERSEVIRQYRLAAIASVLVLCIGATFFHNTEHWSWLNSFYFCTVTLTTVGYGDITPKTDAGKLFDMFYIVVGIGILAAFASATVKNVLVRRQYRQAKRRPNHVKL